MSVIIGLDVGGTALKAGIVVERKITLFSLKLVSNENPLNGIFEVIQELSRKVKDEILAIGIASAGRVDSRRGIILYATNNIPGWSGLDISSVVSRRFHIPVYVLNDAQAAALAEAKTRNIGNLVMLTIGTGLGGGVIINGKLISGSKFEAGEFGHTVLHPDGRKCNCGKNGCAETYISMKVLHRYTKIKSRKELIEKLDCGDSKVIQAVEKVVKDLAVVIDRVFLDFDPDLVVIGGGFSELGERALKIVRAQLEPYASKSLYNTLQVEFSTLGNYAGIIGAALFAEERMKCGG